MTAQQLIGVGVRLFAAWLVLTSIPYFVAIPNQLAATPIPGDRGAVVLSFAIAVAYVVGALLLWFFPMLVANRLLPRSQYTNRLALNGGELARVGCALLGLWLFARALPTLVWFLFRSFLLVGSASSFSVLDAQSRLALIVAVFELAFAMLVIAKAGAFARLVTPKGDSSASSGLETSGPPVDR
jgi:hypothetical protein